ncbi:pectinesterase [Amborella trichopoda]|uniref:Pectinesterase n=1 Tax=Amborella trichopoda TaxID=13333 RepID=W1NJN7_AMBTC|nr:pectinesterase [Amborella trichopoda]ERM96002.1 hypothetical protein AMTR_s00129p00044320 [Amborella trichopoda]|eukprot:XP_006828586.1 pectinesterase [Amborella trichopoda]
MKVPKGKTLIALLLLVAIVALISTVATHKSRHHKAQPEPAFHAVVKSACSSTLYPELCFSSLSAFPAAAEKASSQKDVIEAALNLSITAGEHAYFKLKKLYGRKDVLEAEHTALHDCLELVDETLDELRKTDEELELYPSKKSISDHASDLKTLLSGAMTNQETCLDGFSHIKGGGVRKIISGGCVYVEKLISNALAMIKNMTDTDMAAERSAAGRKLEENNLPESFAGEDGFPAWMSAGDRRLLQSSSVTPNVVVAADGSGDFKTVAAAVAAAPEKSSKRYVIRIKAGVYRENVEVPKKKTNIMFLGDGRMKTIITGSKNVKDGSTTFRSATVAAVGERFLARDITFQNTAGPSKHQAVALRVGSDFSAFYRCDMIAYQDTLYVHSLRQFYRECFIYGTVDFIFGNAAAVLQNCDILARRPNSGQKNMVTAQGREDPNQNTGISIHKCRISADSDLAPVKSSFPTYLGRPWKEYSRTVIMQSTISDVINPAGWHEWNGNFALNTLYYGEYQNTGAGAGTSGRVKWKGYKVITSASEAKQFTVGDFINGGSWLGSTGFPFTAGF